MDSNQSCQKRRFLKRQHERLFEVLCFSFPADWRQDILSNDLCLDNRSPRGNNGYRSRSIKEKTRFEPVQFKLACLSPLSFKVVEKIETNEVKCQTEMECSYVLCEPFAMGERCANPKYIYLQLFLRTFSRI